MPVFTDSGQKGKGHVAFAVLFDGRNRKDDPPPHLTAFRLMYFGKPGFRVFRAGCPAKTRAGTRGTSRSIETVRKCGEVRVSPALRRPDEATEAPLKQTGLAGKKEGLWLSGAEFFIPDGFFFDDRRFHVSVPFFFRYWHRDIVLYADNISLIVEQAGHDFCLPDMAHFFGTQPVESGRFFQTDGRGGCPAPVPVSMKTQPVIERPQQKSANESADKRKIS